MSLRLLIASPSINGQFEGDYVGSLIQTLGALHVEGVYVQWFFARGNSEISRCRDGIASMALRDGFDKLLFVDADQGWRAEDVIRLIRSDKLLIGGTYPKKELPINLNFGVLPQHDHYFPDLIKTTDRFVTWAEAEAPPDGEVEVAYLPTGLMLIDCAVFRKMQEFARPYRTKDSATGEEVDCHEYFPIGVIDGQKDTEDWGFCRFARACDIPAYLNVHAVADHFGTFNYRLTEGQRVSTAQP